MNIAIMQVVFINLLLLNLSAVQAKFDFSALNDLLSSSLLPDEDAFLQTNELIIKYGYPVEEHKVTTADGYILTLFRIPHGKWNANSKRSKEPVLINHGLLTSSVLWLLLAPRGVLPFMYAEAGFDVWLGNFRGTKYALGHKTFEVSSNSFWNFTADHIGLFDVPAQIDYILEATKHPKLLYFGYSMSTTAIFMMLSSRPEYNAKVRRVVAVAPAAYLSNVQTWLFRLNVADSAIMDYFDKNFNGAFVTDQRLQPIAPFVCNAFPSFCRVLFTMFQENHLGEVDKKTLVRLSGQFPDLTGIRVALQYYQYMRSGNFSMFDFGAQGNRLQYGSDHPPIYDLSKIKVPVCGLYGPGDQAIVSEDAFKTLNLIPNWCNRDSGAIENDNWKHIDSIVGKDAPRLVYARSIAFALQSNRECSC